MSRAKILVIEDSLSDVFLLRRTLTMQNKEFELEILEDGESALRYLRQIRENVHDSHPCVILIDLHLPKHDGLAVLKAIHDNPVLGKVPVIVTTNLASPREKDVLAGLGVPYRTKPASLSQYTEFVEEILEMCERPRLAA